MYNNTGRPIPMQISKIFDPYVFEKESLNFLCSASFRERIVSGILEEIAAIKNALMKRLTPNISDIFSTT